MRIVLISAYFRLHVNTQHQKKTFVWILNIIHTIPKTIPWIVESFAKTWPLHSHTHTHTESTPKAHRDTWTQEMYIFIGISCWWDFLISMVVFLHSILFSSCCHGSWLYLLPRSNAAWFSRVSLFLWQHFRKQSGKFPKQFSPENQPKIFYIVLVFSMSATVASTFG